MSIDSTLTRRMSPSRAVGPKKEFVQATLPWVIGAVALAVYALSLNHWVTLSSVEHVARLSGWLPDPQVQGPLFWLLTLPLHWLPLAAVPLALNVFSAVCAALTLVLLGRTVTLLPHDRTEAQRTREKNPFGLLSFKSAWLPPVLAAVVCGLQLTFWENATAASAEMLDLLLFAYVVRCLAEFRLDSRDSWLWRAAVVYGAGMASNWAMVGFFPVFLLALVWLRGAGFFNTRFLLRMFVFGVAGLSLYLLLPIVNAASGKYEMSFWQGLRLTLGVQKYYLGALVFNKTALFRGSLWVLGLPSLLPILALSIRWPAYFGDPSKLGVALTTFIFHFLHGVFLVFCLWVMLDPRSFGPRHQLGGMVSGLTLYYLTALSIGYYLGYFLLVFGAKPAGKPRPTAPWVPVVNRAVLAVVLALSILGPALLLARNVPQIRTSNGALLRRSVTLANEQLPPQGAILLSDDVRWLSLAQSALTQAGKAGAYQFLNTHYLEVPAYYGFLKRVYPLFTKVPVPSAPRNDQELTAGRVKLVQLMLQFAKTNQIYYLHSSFGYYFEGFYPEPHGAVYQLTAYSTNLLTAPLPSDQLVSENEGFWDRADQLVLNPALAALRTDNQPGSGLLPRVRSKLGLELEPNLDALQLSRHYSRALNFWGVELQRAGRLPAAAKRFEQAISLNQDNIAAQINLACNHNLKAGKPAPVELSKSQEEQFGKYSGGWDEVLSVCGPFDEQRSCEREGQAFFQNSNFRQAASEFLRAKELDPDNLRTRVLLAQSYVCAWLPDGALRETADIHAKAEQLGLNRTNAAGVLSAEMAAHLAKGDAASAETALRSSLALYPDDRGLLFNAVRTYMNYNCYSNALPRIDALLSLEPDSTGLLFVKGQSCMGLTNYAEAVTAFSGVLATETNRNSLLRMNALWARAQAYLAKGQYDAAQRDGEAFQRELPDQDMRNRLNASAFLGEVAYRKKDTNTALRIYQLYLTKLPPNEVEAIKVVSTRIKELTPSPH